MFDSVAYSRARHRERMATDPEYRERRKQYAAAATQKRKERRAADAEFDTRARKYERARHHKRMSDPTYADNKRSRGREYAQRILQERPEHVRALKRIAQQTRRARKLNQFLEAVDPHIVYQMHGGCCGICKQFVSVDGFHVDHVIPLSKGGLHGYINVQPAHPLCNIRKGNRA